MPYQWSNNRAPRGANIRRKSIFDTFSARVNYRKMSLRPRNLRGQQLNPVFHFHTKKEDNNEFSHSLIKNARKTGCLKLAGRGLSSGMAIIIVMIVLNACVCMCIVCVCVRCFCFGSPFDRWASVNDLHARAAISWCHYHTYSCVMLTINSMFIYSSLQNSFIDFWFAFWSLVPEKVWNIHDAEKEDIESRHTFHSTNTDTDEAAWWNQKALTNLDLSSNILKCISPSIQNLADLTVLLVSVKVATNSDYIIELSSQTFLSLRRTSNITKNYLQLHDNALTTVPEEIGQLTQLTRLNLSRNKLTQLPCEFYRLRELKQLNLSHNQLTEIDVDITDMVMLEELVSIIHWRQFFAQSSLVNALQNCSIVGFVEQSTDSIASGYWFIGAFTPIQCIG